jgi:hypothetical protein
MRALRRAAAQDERHRVVEALVDGVGGKRAGYREGDEAVHRGREREAYLLHRPLADLAPALPVLDQLSGKCRQPLRGRGQLPGSGGVMLERVQQLASSSDFPCGRRIRAARGARSQPAPLCFRRADGRGWVRTSDLSRVRRALSH